MHTAIAFSTSGDLGERDASHAFGVATLRNVALHLEGGGACCGKVGPGKGCVASFRCYGGATSAISIAMSFPDHQPDGHATWAILFWVHPRPWWRRLSGSRRGGSVDTTVVERCVKTALAEDERIWGVVKLDGSP